MPVGNGLAVDLRVEQIADEIVTGVLSALRRGSLLDRAAMTFSLGGVSLPIFFTGMVALLVFSYKLQWTAPGGTYTPFTEPRSFAYQVPSRRTSRRWRGET